MRRFSLPRPARLVRVNRRRRGVQSACTDIELCQINYTFPDCGNRKQIFLFQPAPCLCIIHKHSEFMLNNCRIRHVKRTGEVIITDFFASPVLCRTRFSDRKLRGEDLPVSDESGGTGSITHDEFWSLAGYVLIEGKSTMLRSAFIPSSILLSLFIFKPKRLPQKQVMLIALNLWLTLALCGSAANARPSLRRRRPLW